MCDVDWCLNYQTKKRGGGRSCMSPMRFELCQSMRRVLSSCWRRMGWAVEGNLNGTLPQVITITHTSANLNGTHPNWDRTPTQARTCFSLLFSRSIHQGKRREDEVQEEDEVIPRRILCKIHVGQAKLTSLTGSVKSVSVINTPNVNLNSRQYLCIHSHM